MSRKPLFKIDLTEKPVFDKALQMESVTPEVMEIALLVLRSFRDHCQSPEVNRFAQGKNFAKVYNMLYNGCKRKMEYDQNKENDALSKAFVWQDCYIVRPDHLYYKPHFKQDGFEDMDVKQKLKHLSLIAFDEWLPVDDLGLVCAEEINKLIEKKFGKCNCMMCQIRRQLAGETEDDSEENDDESSD